MQEIYKAAIGFVFVALAGGIVGAVLQHRAWQYRWRLENNEKLITLSRAVFEDVSRLPDKRLFRARRATELVIRPDRDRATRAIEAYREAHTEWNESLNRHLALLKFYFGQSVRDQLDNVVGDEFVQTHKRLRPLIEAPEAGANISEIKVNFSKIDDLVYAACHASCLKAASALDKREDPSRQPCVPMAAFATDRFHDVSRAARRSTPSAEAIGRISPHRTLWAPPTCASVEP